MQALQLDLRGQAARAREAFLLGLLREQLQADHVVHDARTVFSAHVVEILALRCQRVDAQYGLCNGLSVHYGNTRGAQGIVDIIVRVRLFAGARAGRDQYQRGGQSSDSHGVALGLGFIRRERDETQRVYVRLHEASQGSINHAMPLETFGARELRGDDSTLKCPRPSRAPA